MISDIECVHLLTEGLSKERRDAIREICRELKSYVVAVSNSVTPPDEALARTVSAAEWSAGVELKASPRECRVVIWHPCLGIGHGRTYQAALEAARKAAAETADADTAEHALDHEEV